MTDHIDATQEDREAAGAYWQIARIGNDETQRRYLSGEADESFIVQAFARHRLASTAAIAAERDALAARVEALEAALVHEPKGNDCQPSPTGFHIVDTSMESGCNNCFHCEADRRGYVTGAAMRPTQPVGEGSLWYRGWEAGYDAICHDCGTKHGRHSNGCSATWHTGKCGWCQCEKVVTHPRDYGYSLAAGRLQP